MSLQRLRWVAVLAPFVFLVGVDLVRHLLYPDLFHAWPGYVLVAGVVLFATLLFSDTVFGTVGRLQRRLAQQNRELLALHEAGLDIASELSLEAVLQKVVDQARDLVGARYGALSVPAPAGGIEAFITSGISPEERARIGSPPVGHGLLGVVLEEGQRLRLRDLGQDPRSHGFPPHHPPMHSLLAVPIVSKGIILGNLYLTEKEGAAEFSEDDEDTLVRFATQAALAIENARLHRRARDAAITEERERIAREMHDSLAQVLGYVNTKTQAIRELVTAGQADRAAAQLDQLGQAARDAYADVREGILSLRTTLGPGHAFLGTFAEYLRNWQEQSEVAAFLEVDPPGTQVQSLGPTAELQLMRILQEALTNVRKHASATQVWVRIGEKPGGVEVVVEDNGLGFDPSRSTSPGYPRFGLATLRERAEAVGGTIAIESAPNRGTRVRVWMPAGSATPPPTSEDADPDS